MHAVGPLHSQTPKCRLKTEIFIKNNPHISGPAQFKPMFFKVNCTSLPNSKD